jgi:1,4-dihydroxy-6-naphthoate synthase
MHPYSLAISTCPNDTFIFHALVHGLVVCPGFEERRPELCLADVEELNSLAMRGEVDVCKISAAAWRQVRGDYALLGSGAALGFGCGPVLVARPGADTFRRIAIPGESTTAALLLERHGGFPCERVAMRFDRIMPALAAGEVDAGVLIHEGRFVFHQHGLELVLDLGAWWERATGLPIPLGIIVARRDLGPTFIAALERGVALSLEHAQDCPEASAPWIASLAQELDPATIQRHIETYVTPLSLDMGVEGRRALDILSGEVQP